MAGRRQNRIRFERVDGLQPVGSWGDGVVPPGRLALFLLKTFLSFCFSQVGSGKKRSNESEKYLAVCGKFLWDLFPHRKRYPAKITRYRAALEQKIRKRNGINCR